LQQKEKGQGQENKGQQKKAQKPPKANKGKKG
jgi:hypothetical protein